MSKDLLIFDPNRIDGSNSGYLDEAKLNIDVRLEAVRKQKSSIIVAEGETIVKGTQAHTLDFISGNNVNSNPSIKSLSTLFTEANSQFDIIENGTYKNLETLGIKDININFSSAYTPLITMNLVDVRGRLFQEGNNSPYAVFYDIPYPIFRLTVKGFVGKAVTYDLHLVKFESSFNSDFGGFEIKCEFVGYHYAMLSDMLIGYLKGVEYTDVGSAILADSKFNGLKMSGLREDLGSLRSIIKEVNNTDSQIEVNNSMNAVIALETLEAKISNNFERTKTLISGSAEFVDTLSQNTFICSSTKANIAFLDGFHANNKLFISEYNKSVEGKFKIDEYGTSKYDSVYNGTVTIAWDTNQHIITGQDIHNKQLPMTTLKPAIYNVGTNEVITVTMQFIVDALTKKRKNAEEIASYMKSESAIEFGNMVNNQELSLDIKNYFETICNHVDVLLLSIAQVSKKAMDSPERASYFKTLEGLNSDSNSNSEKILPFPDYKVADPTNKNAFVEQWIGKVQANGKTLPEVEFVEQLMRGWIKAHRLDEEEATLIEEMAENDRLLFTPTHPIDLMISDDYNPYSQIETMNTVDELIKFFMWRSSLFLMTQRFDIDLSENVLRDFITVELENIRIGLRKNKTLSDLFNYSMDGKVNLKTYFKKINNGYISNLLDNGAYSPNTIITTNDFSVDRRNKYVIGNLVRYSPTSNTNIVFGGTPFNDTETIRETWRPLKLGKTYLQGAPNANETPDNNFVVAVSTVSESSSSPTNENVKDVKFSEQKGVPLITKFNRVDSHKNFYKSSNITPNDLKFKHDEIDTTIYTSDLFLGQVTDKSKAMVLLMSVPFKMQENGVGNFSPDIMRMFNTRTGIVRSSFLFTALIGGYLELLDKKFRICVGRKISEEVKVPYICTDFDVTPITLGTDGNYYFDTTGYKLPYAKDLISSGTISFGRNDSSASIDASAFYRLFSADVRKQFVDKFHQFVNIVSKDVLPHFNHNIFIDDLELDLNRAKRYGIGRNATFSFGSNDSTTFYKERGLPNPFKPSNILDVDKFKVFTNKENNSFMGYYFFGAFEAKLIKDTKVYNKLTELINATVDIYNFNSNFWAISPAIEPNDGANALISNNNITNFEIVFNDVLKNEVVEFRKREAESTSAESENIEIFKSNNSEDIRLKIYKDIKNIHDKWVLGNDDYSNISSYTPLINSFRFINRTYKDIGNEFYLNMFTTLEDLRNNLHQPLYGHISKVLSTNNFLFLPMPNYVNLTNIDDLKDMFLPRYYNEVDPITQHTFVCMYVGEYSTKLDLGTNNRFRSDGIEVTNTDGTYNISAVDYVEGTDSPIIIARFGDENQSLFKKFGLSQTEYSVTNESLMITDDITKNNGLGQNLFDIYSMRSYTLTMIMLGNAMVQPFMYFYLEGVPMFYGLYLVTKVNHRVNGNSMETEVTAVRMRQTMTKMVDLDTLYHTLFDQTQLSNSGTSSRKVNTGNLYVGQGFAFAKTSPLANAINYEITNSTGIMIGKDQTEKFGLPETGDFIKEIGLRWNEYAKTQNNVATELMINGLSYRNGGSLKLHTTHKIGTSIDIRPVTNDGSNNPTNVNESNYSSVQTKKLVDIIIEVGNMPKFKNLYAKKNSAIFAIYFNDREIYTKPEYQGIVKFQPEHDNHLHVEFRLPDKYHKYATKNGDTTKFIVDTGDIPQDFTVGNKVNWSGKGFTSNPSDYSKHIGFIDNIDVPKEVKALMEVISYGEGTMGRGYNNGYDLLFNNYRIHGYEVNTNKIRHRGKKGGDINSIGNWSQNHKGQATGASGRYQFMYGTWLNTMYLVTKDNGKTVSGDHAKHEKFNLYFTKNNQDVACARLIKQVLKNYNNIIGISSRNDLRAVCNKLGSTWECFRKVSSTGYNTWDKLYEIYRIALSKYQ